MIKISISTLILQCINFLILVWALKKLLYGPLLNFLDNRSKTVENDLKESKELKKEAEELVMHRNKKLSEARTQALQVLEKAKNSANSERDRIVEDAKNEAKNIMDQAKQQINAYVFKEKENMLTELGSLSVELAEKIIKRELKSEDIDNITKNFIKELESS